MQRTLKYLERLSKQSPSICYATLKKNDIIGVFHQYLIDDPRVYERLPNMPSSGLPYWQVHDSLQRPSWHRVMQIFKDSKLVPFSKVVKDGIGADEEKSVLMQLAAQAQTRSFIICGGMDKIENNWKYGYHRRYNIVVIDDRPHLVDTSDPIINTRNKILKAPYIVPIDGINQEKHIVVVPEKYRHDRTYHIA